MCCSCWGKTCSPTFVDPWSQLSHLSQVARSKEREGIFSLTHATTWHLGAGLILLSWFPCLLT